METVQVAAWLDDPVVATTVEEELSFFADDDASVVLETESFHHVIVGMVILLAVLNERPLLSIKVGIEVAVIPDVFETLVDGVFAGAEVPGDF